MTQDAAAEQDRLRSHFEAFVDFVGELMSESDRACVVLSSAKLEALLSDVTEKFLVQIPTSTDNLLDGDALL